MARPRENCLKMDVGASGYRVTVYEREVGGVLQWRWWIPAEERTHRESMGTKNLQAALDRARQKSAELLGRGEAVATGKYTLGQLLDAHYEEVGRRKTGNQSAEDRARIKLWKTYLGEDFNPVDLTENVYKRFEKDREHGLIEVPGRNLRARVTGRTIGSDIEYLQSVLNWGSKGRLIASNPTAGYTKPKTPVEYCPVWTYERFLAVREHAEAVDPQGLFGALLDLVEGLGWRISQVCELRACDFNPKRSEREPFGKVHSIAEKNKTGADAWVTVPSAEVRSALEHLTRDKVGEVLLFPSPKIKGQAWTKWTARDLLRDAEAAAGLEPGEYGGFHGLRRKWAIEKKGHALRDVMAAALWKTPRIVLKYQQSDPTSHSAVMLDSRKYREGGLDR